MSVWRGQGARDCVTYADALTACSVNIVEADKNAQIAETQWHNCDRLPTDLPGKERVAAIRDAHVRWQEDCRHWRRMREWYQAQIDAGLGGTPIKVTGFVTAVAQGRTVGEDDE